ncbi:cytochrome c oxidase assembly factor 3 homolog, mitochondrial [Thalassophryne amazonica]|uniref:cytochrome c oxidase assembly factor 3 homolog, mitochondrial n=1 Tax=Thalassophryne amazonica TaxID=390379 RepID=UPI001470CA95|nr:cytochrome c oxidase assembly factor 3 homolog, mitochondrial [Thalassophryne amazonica]
MSVKMADKTPKESDNQFAKRINPTKEELSTEQRHFVRQMEIEQWKTRTHKLKMRNGLTGLAIAAVAVGIYGYTFYSVSQERIMDEIDDEAKRAKLHVPKTAAN